MILTYFLCRTIFQLLYSTCQIIAFDKGVLLVNAFVLGKVFEYRCKIHTLPKTRFFWLYYHLTDSMGLPSTNLLALTANTFSIITQNNGHFAVQRHLSHQFWYQSIASMRLLIIQ